MKKLLNAIVLGIGIGVSIGLGVIVVLEASRSSPVPQTIDSKSDAAVVFTAPSKPHLNVYRFETKDGVFMVATNEHHVSICQAK